MLDFKKHFPIYKTNPRLAYLDSAATAQKLAVSLDAELEYYTSFNSNVHRGMYAMAEKATQAYETARVDVAKFIGAEQHEIIFCGGTTDGFNQVVKLLQSLPFLVNPTILLGVAEHHANILPWQKWEGAKLEYLSLNEDFNYDLDSVVASPDIISLSLVSNVTGAVLNLKEVREKFPDALIIVDAAQAVAHMPINVHDLGIDMLIFSGHKLYAPTGVGVIWANYELLQQLEPAKVGGGIIKDVYRTYATWVDAPHKFEAGTPPIAQAIGLAAATNFLLELGFDTITNHEKQLSETLAEWFKSREDLQVFRPKKGAQAIFSFVSSHMHAHDLAFALSSLGVDVRAGHHCTQILHREELKTPATVRVSLGLNNTDEDLEKFMQAMPQALKALE